MQVADELAAHRMASSGVVSTWARGWRYFWVPALLAGVKEKQELPLIVEEAETYPMAGLLLAIVPSRAEVQQGPQKRQVPTRRQSWSRCYEEVANWSGEAPR